MKHLFISVAMLIFSCAALFAQTDNVIGHPGEKTEQAIHIQNTITGSFEMNYLRHYLWRGALLLYTAPG